VAILSSAIITLAGAWFAFGRGTATKLEVQVGQNEVSQRIDRLEDRVVEQLRDLNSKIDRILERTP
jgi:hypothetical protein